MFLFQSDLGILATRRTEYTLSYLAYNSEMLRNFRHLGNEFLNVWRETGATRLESGNFGASRG